MRTLSSLVAVGSLLGAVAFAPVFGGAALSAFVPFGSFVLGLVGVIGGLEDRSVRQNEPAMDPRRWRNGS